MNPSFLAIVAAASLAPVAIASETVTAEPDESSYHFVSHYSIDVAATAEEVWDQLVDVGSWMVRVRPVAGVRHSRTGR